jgi:hypothetical protein
VKRPVAGALTALSLVVIAATLTVRESGNLAGPARLAPADFVVESSSDAGPGTLRDAIVAADRSTSRVRIVISAPRIAIDSALPAIINPHGIEIDAGQGAGVIDADRAGNGAALVLGAPMSVIRGLHITRARGPAILVNAPGSQLESLIIEESKIGILIGAKARGSAVRDSIFERNETAVTADADIRDLTVTSSTFRGNTRAGFWLVGAAAGEAAVQNAVTQRRGEPVAAQSARVVLGVFQENAAGVVVGNRSVSVQRSRFIGNRDSAVLILGGAIRVEDNEVSGNQGTAISVISGSGVIICRNTLNDNHGAAIMVRDSEATISRNSLSHNGLGIVAIVSPGAASAVIRDNLIVLSAADGVTLIGGRPILERNKITDSRGAGLRTLDLWAKGSTEIGVPRLSDNTIQGNAIDLPGHGLYKVPDAL